MPSNLSYFHVAILIRIRQIFVHSYVNGMRRFWKLLVTFFRTLPALNIRLGGFNIGGFDSSSAGPGVTFDAVSLNPDSHIVARGQRDILPLEFTTPDSGSRFEHGTGSIFDAGVSVASIPLIDTRQLPAISSNSSLKSINQIETEFSLRPTDDLTYPAYPSVVPRHKALLIACSYDSHPELDQHLPNSWKDTDTVKKLLLHYGWNDDEIIVLNEKGKRENHPTKENIIMQMKHLVDGARAGDFLFVHMSGHGGQVKASKDPYEIDELDELFLPSDWHELEFNGQIPYILDDEFRQILIDPLPMGCKLLGLIDCCHSGSMWDLPGSATPRISIPAPKQATTSNQPPESLYMQRDTDRMALVESPTNDLDSTNIFLRKAMIERRCQTFSYLPGTSSAPQGHKNVTRTALPTQRLSTLTRSGTGKKQGPAFLPNFSARGAKTSKSSQSMEASASHGGEEKRDAGRVIDGRIILGDVTCISSCPDGESGFETPEGGTLVQAFYKVLNEAKSENRVVTVGELKETIKHLLHEQHENEKRKFDGEWNDAWKSPVPTFSFSRPWSWDHIFTVSLQDLEQLDG